MEEAIKLRNGMYPSNLKFVRGYRGYTQADICKNISGISQSNLSKYEKGHFCALSEEKLKAIMNFLNWPYEFLFTRFPEVKYCG